MTPTPFWVRMRAQLPKPLSPLAESTLFAASGHGYRAAQAFHGITDSIDATIINGYAYHGWPDTGRLEHERPPDPDQLMGALRVIPSEWDTRILPSIQAIHSRLRALAPPDGSSDRLANDVEEGLGLLKDLWTHHFELLPAFIAPGALAEVLASFGVPDPGRAAHTLVNPTANVMADIEGGFLDLGAILEEDPAWWALVTGSSAESLVDRLLDDKTDIGNRFRELWPRVSDRIHAVGLFDPTWREDPTPVQHAVTGGVAARDAAIQGRLQAETLRNRQEEDALRRIPSEAQAGFLELLDVVRAAAPLKRSHHYWIDDTGSGLTRLMYLRAAEPLVREGILRDAGEVVFLTHDEVCGALRGRTLPRNLVDQRRNEREAWLGRTPPDVIGIPTAMALRHPVIGHMHGIGLNDVDGTPSQASLRGHGASPGQAAGIARIVRADTELERLETGDVLVCEMSDPCWTTAMTRAAAIVTTSGGILCHAASVAREFGIPCVTGVRDAFDRVRPGARITVDGDQGTVLVEGD